MPIPAMPTTDNWRRRRSVSTPKSSTIARSATGDLAMTGSGETDRSLPFGRSEQAKAAPDFDRRTLLKAMGASLALAGLAGCSGEPDEAALPYVTAPETVVPG